MSQEKIKPAHVIRRGNIKATIWKNETNDSFANYSINIRRSYRLNDSWRTTDALGVDDAPKARRCLELAEDWIFEAKSIKATDLEANQAIAA